TWLASSTNRIIFQPAAGATVTVGVMKITGQHVELRGIKLRDGVTVGAGSNDVVLRDVSTANLFIFSAQNFQMLGGEVGPGTGLDYDSILSTAGPGLPPP